MRGHADDSWGFVPYRGNYRRSYDPLRGDFAESNNPIQESPTVIQRFQPVNRSVVLLYRIGPAARPINDSW